MIKPGQYFKHNKSHAVFIVLYTYLERSTTYLAVRFTEGEAKGMYKDFSAHSLTIYDWSPIFWDGKSFNSTPKTPIDA